MALSQHLEDIQARLRRSEYPNEAAVSGGIVRRVFEALGWPVYDPHVVFPEYSVRGRRVDFALCHPAGKPRVFVEVKQPGLARGADQQLFEYAFHEGVPMAVMTDGREWHVYVPAGAGSYDERRVYLLDLLERTPDEAAERLHRYLAYERVRTEDAVRAARDDYDRIARSREGERYLPDAWRRLLADADPVLAGLLAERVESLCGVRPDEARVTAFLQRRAEASFPELAATPKQAKRTPRAAPPVPSAPLSPLPASAPQKGYTLDGVFHPARSQAAAYRAVMAYLIERHAGFAERFAEQSRGRTRENLSPDREALFPGRPDLQKQSSARMPNGWWLGYNVSVSTLEKHLQTACRLTGRTFGQDVRLHF